MIIISSIVSLLGVVVLICLVGAGVDEIEKRLEDEEQIRYLREWSKEHGKRK